MFESNLRDIPKPFTNTRILAYLFNKPHSHFMRKIRQMEKFDDSEDLKFSRLNYQLRYYVDSRGRRQPLFEISGMGFSILYLGYPSDADRRTKIFLIKELSAFNKQQRAVN